MIPEVYSPDETTTPQPKKKKVSYRSVMTKDITALLLSNLAMCLASEALFTVYPLFAFTPIESGMYRRFTGALRARLVLSFGTSYQQMLLSSSHRRFVFLRKSNRRIPCHPCIYPNRHHVPLPHDASKLLYRTRLCRQIVPNLNVPLAPNIRLLPLAKRACPVEAAGSTQWVGV